MTTIASPPQTQVPILSRANAVTVAGQARGLTRLMTSLELIEAMKQEAVEFASSIAALNVTDEQVTARLAYLARKGVPIATEQMLARVGAGPVLRTLRPVTQAARATKAVTQQVERILATAPPASREQLGHMLDHALIGAMIAPGGHPFGQIAIAHLAPFTMTIAQSGHIQDCLL